MLGERSGTIGWQSGNSMIGSSGSERLGPRGELALFSGVSKQFPSMVISVLCCSMLIEV